jgi:hypothetical protein
MMLAEPGDHGPSSKKKTAAGHRCRSPEADEAKDGPINQTGPMAPLCVAIGIVVDRLMGVV